MLKPFNLDSDSKWQTDLTKNLVPQLHGPDIYFDSSEYKLYKESLLIITF